MFWLCWVSPGVFVEYCLTMSRKPRKLYIFNICGGIPYFAQCSQPLQCKSSTLLQFVLWLSVRFRIGHSRGIFSPTIISGFALDLWMACPATGTFMLEIMNSCSNVVFLCFRTLPQTVFNKLFVRLLSCHWGVLLGIAKSCSKVVFRCPRAAQIRC